MDIQEQIQYWIDTAEHDLKTAEHLFEKGDYAWCLFIGHLVLEKFLKALYVRDKQQIPPRTHNLVMLVKATTLAVTPEQEQFLYRVNDFNLEACYPDVKQTFYTLCTEEFTTTHFTKIKEYAQWFKSQITSSPPSNATSQL